MKLIRDRTPGLLEKSTRPVRDKAEFEILLRAKIMEEAAEVASACSKEELLIELADLSEVLGAFIDLMGFGEDDILRAADMKYEKKGGFDDGVVLLHDPLTNK